ASGNPGLVYVIGLLIRNDGIDNSAASCVSQCALWRFRPFCSRFCEQRESAKRVVGKEKMREQPYGTGAAAECTSLPRPDPLRDLLPIPRNAERTVQDTRGEESRCPEA